MITLYCINKNIRLSKLKQKQKTKKLGNPERDENTLSGSEECIDVTEETLRDADVCTDCTDEVFTLDHEVSTESTEETLKEHEVTLDS